MSLAFAPRPLRSSGPLHGRAAAVVALCVAFLACALLKPWQGTAQTLPAPTVTPRATPAHQFHRAQTPPAPVRLGPAALSTLTLPRDGWGVRIISATDSGVLSETWIPATASLGTGWPSFQLPPGTAVSRAPAERVVAVGITAPFDQTPLSVRAWQLCAEHSARLVALRDAAGEAAGSDRSAAAAAYSAPLGRRVFLPPLDAALYRGASGASVDGIAVARPDDRDAARPTRWPGGVYRFDVLVGGQVRALTLQLPASFDSGQIEPTWVDTGATARAQVDDVLRAADFPVPQLAWVDGAGILRLTDARQANASSAADDLAPRVSGPAQGVAAAAYLDGAGGDGSWIVQGDVAAVGVVLPRGAIVRDIGVTQLSPYLVRVPAGSQAADAVRGAPSNAALVWSSTGVAFEGGIYRIDARWWSGGADHRASWLAGLSGGTSGDAAPDAWWQAALRAYPYAGSWGVVATGDPSAQQRRSRVARATPVVPMTAGGPDSSPGPAAFVAGCTGDALLDDEQSLLAVTVPPEAGSVAVGVEQLRRAAAPTAVKVVSAPTPTPGLTLIALQDGGRWRPGVYRVTVVTVGGAWSFDIGIGITEPLSGAVLPPCSAGA